MANDSAVESMARPRLTLSRTQFPAITDGSWLTTARVRRPFHIYEPPLVQNAWSNQKKMLGFRIVAIREYETAVVFRHGKPSALLDTGRHILWGAATVVKFDRRKSILLDSKTLSNADRIAGVKSSLPEIVGSGLLNDKATVVDLNDNQRGLVWVDDRFFKVLPAGLFAFWNEPRNVRVEVVDVSGDDVQLRHKQLAKIIESDDASSALQTFRVGVGMVGVKLIDDRYVETVPPGLYAFWRSGRTASVVQVDTRETQLDISGQELMTADRVTMRLNLNVVYRVQDPARVVEVTSNVQQALYREVQLALRTAVGARNLDDLLTDRESLSEELSKALDEVAQRLGVELISVGVRDIILPGEMKELLNRVVEARKAAEANLITRREETAAIRSQANTAKLLTDNPALMRLRELETLERVAESGSLQVLVGEGGLTNKLTKLI